MKHHLGGQWFAPCQRVAMGELNGVWCCDRCFMIELERYVEVAAAMELVP